MKIKLLIANADGSNEQVIFRHESRDKGFNTNPSWSASGNLIAVGAYDRWGRTGLHPFWCLRQRVKLVKSFPLPMLVGTWHGCPILPDCSSSVPKNRLASARRSGFSLIRQGEPFKISNDLSQYVSLSVTADGKSFVTTQERPAATIYVGDSPAVLNDKIDWKLTPISTEQATGYALSWTAAGKLLQRIPPITSMLPAATVANRVHLLQNDPVVQDPLPAVRVT